jgi:hypothetical protein
MSTTLPKVEQYTLEKTKVEEHKVAGEKLVTRVRELLHEGNIRRIILKSEDGTILMEIPLTVGVVGAVLLPVWVALGAIAALAAHYRIAVEKAPLRKAAEEPTAEPFAFHSRPDM